MNSTLGLSASTPASIDVAADALLPELSALVVSAVNLDLAPGDVAADESLYGEGLGLDSIDILEIALVVSKKYGFQLHPDDESNKAIFTSMRHLARHIAQHRTA
jgi:acyl carrier protein